MTLRAFGLAGVGLASALLMGGCGDSTGSGEPEGDSNTALALSGGAMTVFDATSTAFKTPAPNLGADRLQRHLDGDVQFEATFVTAPAPVNPGLARSSTTLPAAAVT